MKWGSFSLRPKASLDSIDFQNRAPYLQIAFIFRLNDCTRRTMIVVFVALGGQRNGFSQYGPAFLPFLLPEDF